MDSEHIEQEAARWLTRRDSGVWSDADECGLNAWLDEQTAHRIAFIRLSAGWQQTARLKALGAGVVPKVIPPRGNWGDFRLAKSAAPPLPFSFSAPQSTFPSSAPNDSDSPGAVHLAAQGTGRKPLSVTNPSLGAPHWLSLRSWNGSRVRTPGAAATLLFIVTLALLIFEWRPFGGDRYSTAVGALEKVSLADGSRVTLNTNSRIRVELAPQQRSIVLDQGEAFFEVSKDARRPFVVNIGNKRVTAVGTKFSVRRDHEDIQVVVSEGTVRVDAVAGDRASGSADVLVNAGGVAQTERSEVLVHQHAGPEVEQLLSWRSGYLVFRDVTLADAVAEFNRYNTRKIIIQDPKIANIRIGGNFRSNNTDAFLSLVQSGFPITAALDTDRVLLKSR